MHVWDKSKSTCVDYLFSPWLFGSQPPSVLLGTFSTIINFNILGLLRRLHKLQILFEIESQISGTGIIYPNITTKGDDRETNTLYVGRYGYEGFTCGE